MWRDKEWVRNRLDVLNAVESDLRLRIGRLQDRNLNEAARQHIDNLRKQAFELLQMANDCEARLKADMFQHVTLCERLLNVEQEQAVLRAYRNGFDSVLLDRVINHLRGTNAAE